MGRPHHWDWGEKGKAESDGPLPPPPQAQRDSPQASIELPRGVPNDREGSHLLQASHVLPGLQVWGAAPLGWAPSQHLRSVQEDLSPALPYIWPGLLV